MSINMTIIFPVRSHNVPFLGIMYLSSFLKREGYAIRVVNANYKEIAKVLCQEKHAVIAYSVMTYESTFFIELPLLEDINAESILVAISS